MARDETFQISARGHALGFHHISDLGDLNMISNLALTAPLLSDGDNGEEEMKATRVSLKASLGVGLVWVWAGSTRASSDWALADEFGLGPLI